MDADDKDYALTYLLSFLNEANNMITKKHVPTDMTVTLPDGITITGSKTQIAAVLTKLGEDGSKYTPTGFYWSSSKGLVDIESMATPHIKNALLLEYKQWVEDLRRMTDIQFINTLKIGAGANSVIQSLAQELNNRQTNGLL